MNVWNLSTLTVAMQRKNKREKLVGNNFELFVTICGKFHERTKFLVFMREDSDLQQVFNFSNVFQMNNLQFRDVSFLIVIEEKVESFRSLLL